MARLARKTNRQFESLSARDIARVYNVSNQSVGGWHKAGCPRNADRTYSLAEVIAWRETRLREAADAAAVKPSDAKGRQDEERARLLQLTRMEREGALMPRETVRESHAKMAGILRMAGDRLQRRFGPEAHEILEQAIEAYLREVQRVFGGTKPNGNPSN